MIPYRLRQNMASFVLLEAHAPAYRAGQFSVRRDQNLNQARRLKRTGQGSVKLFVDFARDDHHHYLKCLREIRNERDAFQRIQRYESTVMDRVMGVLHR